MQAAISGIARKALIVDGESLKVFDTNEPMKLVDCRPSDVPYVFGEGRDVRFIENVNVESIAKELRFDSDLTLALDLTLISLDGELEEDIRKDAIRDLDELILDEQLTVRLEGIMYGRPLPEESDLESVLKACDDLHVPNASEFFDSLGLRQSLISNVSAAWDVIPTKIFGGDDQKTDFQRVAVQRGLFRTLVTFLESSTNVTQFLLTAGLDATIRQLRNSREVLQQWAAPFRQSGEALIISSEVDEESETHAIPRRRHGRRVGIDRPAVLREVNRKKATISAAIRRRDFGLVPTLVEDLVIFQRMNGETTHLAKSLCDLAMEAKELGLFSLQLELTERSVGEAPDDGWSWAQHGDAFLQMNRLPEALRAYRQADSFGAGAIAKRGYGEVLKAQGRLNEALIVFDEVIGRDPGDVVAKTGRAEVLKAQGRFDDALVAFDAVIAGHPEDPVAKTGRAQVLKAQGRLDEALAAFDAVIAWHPEHVIAKNGRAEVLKAKGRLDDALDAFDAVIDEHPENVVAKTARAEVFKTRGRLDDALDAFNAVIDEHPENVVAKNGRAEVLKAQGRLDDAVDAFNAVIDEHPENVVAKNGRAEVLKAQGRLDDALDAFDAVIARHPEDVVAKNGRAEVLKAQGRFSQALAAYEQIVRHHPENRVARTGKISIFVATGRYEEALSSLQVRNPITLDDWIDFHILGIVLLRMKKLNDAIKIFQRGVDETPFPVSRAYFQTALAMALIQQRKYDAAEILLGDIEAPSLEPQIKLLHLHASGEEGHDDEARVNFEDLTPKPWSVSDELLDELHRRYILKEPAKHSDEWLFDQEVSSLLLVSTQQISTNYAS